MELLKKITPIKGLVVIGTIAVLVVAFLIAMHSYFSYVEVTEASNGCYDLGGVPSVEKTGLRMTKFHCNME